MNIKIRRIYGNKYSIWWWLEVRECHLALFEICHLRRFYPSQKIYQIMVFIDVYEYFRLPSWSSAKEPTCQCRRCRKGGFDPYIKKIPWRKKWQPTPVFLPEKLHGQRSLAGYLAHGFTKSRTWLSDWAWLSVSILLYFLKKKLCSGMKNP